MNEQTWTRRDRETNPAYEAFRTYLKLRSATKVATELGKSLTLITRWSAEHEWISRAADYDSYVMTADTDGMVHALAETRDKNLALMDKLRGLLDSRLDDFIARRDDPTIRWTQACIAMTKIEANSLAMGETKKASEKVIAIEALVEKALELQNRVPEEA
jgi:hypothetical protein